VRQFGLKKESDNIKNLSKTIFLTLMTLIMLLYIARARYNKPVRERPKLRLSNNKKRRVNKKKSFKR